MGIRGPDGEGRPGGVADLTDVRAEHAPQFLVPAFPDQVQVELAQRRQVPVRVIAQGLVLPGGGVRGGDPVVRDLLVRQGDGEEALVHRRHGEPAAVVENERHRLGERAERPDDDPVRSGMRAQHRVRVMMVSGDNPLDLAQAKFGICHGSNSICVGYNSARDCRGMGSQVGRFLASYMTS